MGCMKAIKEINEQILMKRSVVSLPKKILKAYFFQAFGFSASSIHCLIQFIQNQNIQDWRLTIVVSEAICCPNS